LDKSGETSTSQLGWHPEKPPSFAINLKILLKKRKKYIQKGRTRPKPSKQRMQGKKNRLGEFVIGQTTAVTKEIKTQLWR